MEAFIQFSKVFWFGEDRVVLSDLCPLPSIGQARKIEGKFFIVVLLIP